MSSFLKYGVRSIRNIFFVVLCACLLAAQVVSFGYADETESTDSSLSEEIESGNAVNTQQLPDSSFIYDTSIVDLSTADTYYDGQTVQVTGEVVGDKIADNLNEGYCWVVLSSENDSATISVYMSVESASKIDTYGQYGSVGTTLQVQGTYNLVCEEHDGLSDLHATSVTVVEPGKDVSDSFDFESFIPGIIVTAVGLAMMGIFYWLRERRR